MDKGFYEYDSRELDAARLTARKFGAKLPDIAEFNISAVDWDQLHKCRKDAVRCAKQILDGVDDGADGEELRKAEHAHDVSIALLDLLDGEMDKRKGNGRTSPLAHMRPNGADMSVNGGDGSIARTAPASPEWRDRDGNVVRVLAPNERLEERGSDCSVGDMLRAMLYGARNEAEKRALAEGTDSAGGYTVPNVLAGEFIDKLRNATVCFRAGARTVPMTSDNLSIAKLTGDPTVAWTAENAQIAASDPTFGVVTLVPKKLLCLVKVSRELLEDSINVNQILETAMVNAMSVEMDRALLFGSGSSNQPLGLVNIAGINANSMGTNGATPTSYDELVETVYSIQAQNGSQPTAFVMNPRTNKTYAKIKNTIGDPVREPQMTADVSRFLTNAVPINQTQGTASGVCSTVIAGDFSQMLIGMRRELTILRTDQLYLENDQVGFLARLRVDMAVTQPVHFATLVGIKP